MRASVRISSNSITDVPWSRIVSSAGICASPSATQRPASNHMASRRRLMPATGDLSCGSSATGGSIPARRFPRGQFGYSVAVATDPEVPTLASVMHRAAEVVDPSGADDDGVWDLYRRLEDRDEPVSGISKGMLEQTLAEASGFVDPQEEDPAVQMQVAVATYLAFRRDEVDDTRDNILRLAARAEFDGKPPAGDRVVARSAGRRALT